MTISRNSRFQRFAGLCGVIAPPLSFSLIFYAVAISPWFSWQTNALSDLGVYSHPSAVPFNVALVSGGVLTTVLVLGIGQWIGAGWLGRAGTLFSLVGAVALGLIGVFPENHLGPHWISAATYFLVTPIGYALLGAEIWRKGRRAHGAAAVSAAMAAFLAIFFVPHDGIAVPELVSALLLCSRSFSVGMKLWLDKEDQAA
jgi:hypothetical membrane protein